MARTRQIKPHFLRSSSMSKVSVGAQLTFIRLWLIADDAGRIADSDWPPDLQVALFPFEDEPQQHLSGWLEELERVGCIVRYRVDGKPYLRVVNWRKHQRICHPAASRLPAEAQGARETLERISRSAPERIVNNVADGPSSRDQAPVLGKSSIVPERFEKDRDEAAI